MNRNIFWQKYLAEKISLKRSGGNLSRLSSVLAKATIDLNPHQIYAALYAFNSPLSRGAILADEVGLGKTIEAGIIIAQLWAEGKKQILILTPASLRKQWQDELLSKFGLESEIWDGLSFMQAVSGGKKTPLTYEGIFIISYHFAYKNLGIIEKQAWGAVIIDEAHRFRRVYRGRDASKMAFAIREAIADLPKALLTATPLQNSLEELYGIASFIDDKLLGSPYSFKKKFVQPIKENTDLAEVRTKELKNLIRGEDNLDPDSISGIISRTLRKQVVEYIRFTDRKSMTFDFTPSDEESQLYNFVSEYLQRERIAAINHTQRNLMILVYRKLLASSSFAIAGTLKKLIENLEAELDLRSQKRAVTSPEQIEDEGLEEEFEELELESAEVKDEKRRVDDSFTDAEIKNEIAELKSFYNLAAGIKQNTKGIALMKALNNLFEQASKNNWPNKAIIFTESTRTQNYVKGLLEKEGITYTEFNGSNNSPKAKSAFSLWKKKYPEAASQGSATANIRQALVDEFKNNTQVFLTTEAGSEGLNLQFANIVVNYDLPWNPQRVEQRIGRSHRYGQKYEVIVTNFLNTQNYADKRVLELLGEKLNLFNGLFGSSDEILGALESGVDFEKRILDIYQSCKSPEEYEKAFNLLQETLGDKVEKDVLKYRKILLENTDQSVAELFRKTDAESKKVLSEYDEDLLAFCIEYFGSKVKQIDEATYTIEGHNFPIAFRDLKDIEAGVMSRASIDIPIVNEAVNKAKELSTNPIPSIELLLSKHNSKITQLNKKMGTQGLLFLWKLQVRGVESDEQLVPFAFIQGKESYEPLELTTAADLLTVVSRTRDQQIVESPISMDELLKQWNEWKEPALAKYKNRNEKLFDRESDRINRYYDDFDNQVADKMQKYESEYKDISRRRDNSADFEERRKLQKHMQTINIQVDKLRVQQLKLRQEASSTREKELGELWSKLDLKIDEHLIAVTHFVLA